MLAHGPLRGATLPTNRYLTLQRKEMLRRAVEPSMVARARDRLHTGVARTLDCKCTLVWILRRTIGGLDHLSVEMAPKRPGRMVKD